jgi:hypothetical protein
MLGEYAAASRASECRQERTLSLSMSRCLALVHQPTVQELCPSCRVHARGVWLFVRSRPKRRVGARRTEPARSPANAALRLVVPTED